MAANTNNTQKENLLKACKVTTGKGILSYAYIWEPRAEEEGDKPKYSTSFLIPKTDVKTLQKIKDAINAAAQIGQTDKWNGKIPTPLKHPLRDGDAEANEKGEVYRGHYFINANSTRKPRVVDLQLQDILDKDEVYSGCVARLSINFYAYNSPKGGKGVACGLNHVQKIEDGEPLGAANSKVEDDFADMDDLDLPFGNGDVTVASGKPTAPATPVKQGDDDILNSINFGESAA